MLPETVARLSEIKNIIGIKEATGNLKQVSDVIEYSREGFCVLSGDDFTTFPLLALGGHGVISVTSNIAPGDMSEMCSLFLSGKLEEAREMHYKLEKLNRVLFIETNPIPVKTALSIMGMVSEEFRLPLVKMAEDNRGKVKQAIGSYGLI
jgi:4-hydroxy-tetrahydrodipicolinate synthase